MQVGIHYLTSVKCHTGKATIHIPAQHGSEASADSHEPAAHGSSAATLYASCALLAAGQDAHALPCCGPNLLIQAIEYCIEGDQGSALLLSVGYVPAPAGEAICPKCRGQCPSATSQAILAFAATFRGGPATASFTGVQHASGGHMCAMSSACSRQRSHALPCWKSAAK